MSQKQIDTHLFSSKYVNNIDTFLLQKDAKVIGATTIRPSKKLPEDLEKFMQSANDGVVLVSYGSMASILDDKRSAILAKAFSMLKYKVYSKKMSS